MTRILLPFALVLALTGCSKNWKGDGDDPNALDNGEDDDSFTDGEDDDDDGGEEGDEGGDDGGDDGGGDDGTVGETYEDDDGDGFTEDEGDCDDSNPDVAPNQAEECNGVDDDCNGQIDEVGSDGNVYYDDTDGDGYGDPATATEACDQPPGTVTNGGDCDDDEYTANPDGTEIDWNDIDEDCDGSDVDVDNCVAEAINATAEYMTDGAWVIDAYEGTYYETITPYGFAVADWQIANQYLYMTETSTSFSDDGAGGFDATFEVDVGMNDTSYSGTYWQDSTTGDTWYEGPFWIDVEMDEIYSYLGIEYSTYCDAWVTQVPQSFEGNFSITIDESNQTVMADVQLDSNRTVLTAADVETQSVTGEAVCQIDIIDAVIDQLGYGDTLGILDETFETTLTELEATYEDALEYYVDAYCSAE